MRDLLADVLGHLQANAPLVAVVGGRIYAGTATPPNSYKPTQGACIVFDFRGGQPAYEGMERPRLQTKTYGLTPYVAQAGYRALVDALHEVQGGNVRWAKLSTYGQNLLEPETDWHFVLAFFELMIRSE